MDSPDYRRTSQNHTKRHQKYIKKTWNDWEKIFKNHRSPKLRDKLCQCGLVYGSSELLDLRFARFDYRLIRTQVVYSQFASTRTRFSIHIMHFSKLTPVRKRLLLRLHGFTYYIHSLFQELSKTFRQNFEKPPFIKIYFDRC